MGNAPPRRRLSGDRAFRRASSTAERVHDWDWQVFAEGYRQRNPMCLDCLERGITEAAAEVHHLKKLRECPELKYEESNLRPLCKTCHGVRTERGE